MRKLLPATLLWSMLAVTALAQVQSHQNQTVTKTLIQSYYKLTNTPSGNFITMPPPGHKFQARVDATKPNGTHVIADTGLVVTNNPVYATVTITAGAGYWHFATEGEVWCPVGQFGQVLQTYQDWARFRKTIQCYSYLNGCQSAPGGYTGIYKPIAACDSAPLEGTCIGGQQGFTTPEADPAPTCSPFVQTKYDFFEESKDGQLSHTCMSQTKVNNSNCDGTICGDYDP